MAPTPQNAPCWQETVRPREIWRCMRAPLSEEGASRVPEPALKGEMCGGARRRLWDMAIC